MTKSYIVLRIAYTEFDVVPISIKTEYSYAHHHIPLP